MNKPLEYWYDVEDDVLTICGIRYSGDMFRQFALAPVPVNRLLKIVRRDDATTIEVATIIDQQLSDQFDKVARR